MESIESMLTKISELDNVSGCFGVLDSRPTYWSIVGLRIPKDDHIYLNLLVNMVILTCVSSKITSCD